MYTNKKPFFCEICGYKSDHKSNFEKHLQTQKHVFRKTSKKVCKSDRRYFCECGKKYKYSQGLYTHRKKCDFKEKNNIEEIIQERVSEEVEKQRKIDSETTNKKLDLCMDIIQNQVLPNMQQSAITNINNTTNNTTNNTNNTNNFNLNIFLNETCKDAINITEFIENLKVGLQELEFVKDNGIVQGISNVFVNELNALDIDKRPIHCTDAKRKTLYIKDDDKWDKEDKATNEKIDRSIQHVKKKHVDSIKEWEEEHPNWCDSESLTMEYLRMVRNSTTPIDKSGEKKIISDVAAEVDIAEIKNKTND